VVGPALLNSHHLKEEKEETKNLQGTLYLRLTLEKSSLTEEMRKKENLDWQMTLCL